jgi:hypothetical protein
LKSELVARDFLAAKIVPQRRMNYNLLREDGLNNSSSDAASFVQSLCFLLNLYRTFTESELLAFNAYRTHAACGAHASNAYRTSV